VVPGWHQESYRHSLARRGIKTGYYAKIDYAKTAQVLKSFFSDGRPETEDYEKSVKVRRVQSLLGEVYRELHKEEQAGKITSENADRFVREDFQHEEKDYLNNTTTYQQFHDNVMRKLGKHKEQNCTTLGVFSWAKEQEVRE
jgi:hypothetical protein